MGVDIGTIESRNLRVSSFIMQLRGGKERNFVVFIVSLSVRLLRAVSRNEREEKIEISLYVSGEFVSRHAHLGL